MTDASNYTPGERTDAEPAGPARAARSEGLDDAGRRVLSDRVTLRVAGDDVGTAAVPVEGVGELFAALLAEIRALRHGMVAAGQCVDLDPDQFR